MSETIVSVEGLGKRYSLRHQTERYTALRDVVTSAAAKPFRNLRSRIGKEAARNGNGSPDVRSQSSAFSLSRTEEFWALRDINFEVKRGEVVGIIGRNGAGKSTLLKILSRITEPTEGRVRIVGRVASLLEVGTGFHPELTGRENIFLNGAILGMHRSEIKAKFDEIVAFAEVEKFLDTPVKRYSSGMYVRLAFAVAAHLEPEILVVDEVLAVGDAEFQKKCLGKMESVAKGEGRTVLFVSHNMATIEHLCERAILLRNGRVAADGTATNSIAAYLSDALTDRHVSLDDWSDRITNNEARITCLTIEVAGGDDTIRVGSSLVITFEVTFRIPVMNPTFGVIVHSSSGEPLIDLRSLHDGLQTGRLVDKTVVQVRVASLGLYPGRYFLSPWVADATCRVDIDFPRLCCAFDVQPSAGDHGDLRLDSSWGKFFVSSRWKVECHERE